ncbi:MAG: BMP family ABC transporter substrate-binding protein [Cyanobium sp.]
MPNSTSFSRRIVLRGLLAAGSLALVKTTAGCSPAKQSGVAGKDGKDLIVGFIYVGPKDDYGYNQAHAEGATALAKMAGIKVVEEANVPETTAVVETMRNMIEVDGATLLFPTSFGYFDPHVLKLAQEYPNVQFLHCGGLYQPGHPKNVGSYFGYIDEAQYVAGIVAAHTSKTGQLGFIAAKPIPQVLRNINSFTLGARSVKPDITTQVVFTGNWSEPVKEAEATNSLVDQGIDVLTCHVDSPKIIMETAEKRGIFCSGYHTDQAALAPKGYLTGAEWDWSTVYQNYGKDVQAGKSLANGGIPHLYRGGLADKFVEVSPYGLPVSADAKKDADTAQQKLRTGELVIYTGQLKDNQGKVVIPQGQLLKQRDLALEKMDWLVAGVKGSTKS